MGFVKNLKSKLEEHFIPDENEIENDEYEAYEDAEDEYEDSADIFSNDGSSYNYSPESALNPPEYVRYGHTPKSQPREEKTYVNKQSKSNIYNMNTVKPQNKFKLNFIALHDIYDAKNVANIMIDQNAMVVVNLGLLSDEQKRRAMDFLDGAKYVTNSIFTRFTENICAFLPEGVELHGDFYGQVELDNLGSF